MDADSEKLTPSEASRAASSSRNLPVVEEWKADAEVATMYERYRAHFGRPHVPGILKCFATHPPLLRSMMELAEKMLFMDGDLTRRHKEMIATLVSAQNACPYCADSHGSVSYTHLDVYKRQGASLVSALRNGSGVT